MSDDITKEGVTGEGHCAEPASPSGSSTGRSRAAVTSSSSAHAPRATPKHSPPTNRVLTVIALSSLLGRSANLTFFTATVSPVPQFSAR